MKNLKYNKKGITLIALVITIIILLILAGITIATLTGDNGILIKTNEAKEKTEQSEKDEKTNLARTEDIINKHITGIEVEQVTDQNPGILEGSGTDTDPYTINSIEDLIFFAYDVTNGNTYEGKTIELGLSLDFNSTRSYVEPLRTDYGKYGYAGELKTLLTQGEGFKSIGTNYDANINNNYFCGKFDGNYNTIYNLYQNYENSDYTSILGFFSTNAGEISNLLLVNANLNSLTNNMHIVSGIIAGRNKGTIANCASNGILKITDNGIKSTYCGGITGQSMGIIENSYSKTNIEVTSNNKATINIGGIAGALTDSYVKFCYNTGDINIYINSDIKVMVGGITGYNEKTIENSYNIGTINIQSSCEITNSFLIGNIIGYLNGTDSKVANCFNIGKINMDLLKNNNSTSSIGNIIGSSYKGNMNNCYNTGFINNKNPELNAIGQIAGNLANTGIISNCLGIVENQINVIGSQSYNVSLNYVTLVEKNQIPDIMEVIGENFKPDNNINNGYPILNWQ